MKSQDIGATIMTGVDRWDSIGGHIGQIVGHPSHNVSMDSGKDPVHMFKILGSVEVCAPVNTEQFCGAGRPRAQFLTVMNRHQRRRS
jgi:hypothetical protein